MTPLVRLVEMHLIEPPSFSPSSNSQYYYLNLTSLIPSSPPAGLVYGTKFHGRSVPCKGKGNRPVDDRYDDWVTTKTLVPGRSFVSVR